MNAWSRIRMILTLSCEESTRLASDGLDTDLTRSQRWALRLHCLLCRSCANFRRQIAQLRENLLSDTTDREAAPAMPDDVRRRIAAALDDCDRS